MTGTNIERHGPLGFYHLAEDFFLAACHTADAQQAGTLRLRFSHSVIYHKHTHSIELALKAFLRTTGVKAAELKRRYGHDMRAMLTEAIGAGLSLGSEEAHTRAIVEWLNTHGKAQTFRYFEAGYIQLPAEQDVRAANKRLLSAVKPACMAALRATLSGPSGSANAMSHSTGPTTVDS